MERSKGKFIRIGTEIRLLFIIGRENSIDINTEKVELSEMNGILNYHRVRRLFRKIVDKGTEGKKVLYSYLVFSFTSCTSFLMSRNSCNMESWV